MYLERRTFKHMLLLFSLLTQSGANNGTLVRHLELKLTVFRDARVRVRFFLTRRFTKCF